MISERPTFCDDWGCPAHVSCGRHYGRSEHFAAMSASPVDFARPPRAAGAEACDSYTRDVTRPWLIEAHR